MQAKLQYKVQETKQVLSLSVRGIHMIHAIAIPVTQVVFRLIIQGCGKIATSTEEYSALVTVAAPEHTDVSCRS